MESHVKKFSKSSGKTLSSLKRVYHDQIGFL